MLQEDLISVQQHSFKRDVLHLALVLPWWKERRSPRAQILPRDVFETGSQDVLTVSCGFIVQVRESVLKFRSLVLSLCTQSEGPAVCVSESRRKRQTA